jgi:hypothetical protein
MKKDVLSIFDDAKTPKELYDAIEKLRTLRRYHTHFTDDSKDFIPHIHRESEPEEDKIVYEHAQQATVRLWKSNLGLPPPPPIEIDPHLGLQTVSQWCISATDLASTKPEETKRNAKMIIFAILVSIVMILVFELFVYFGPFTWLKNHPNSYGIQGSIICLIPCLILGFFKPRWQNWCWGTAVLAFLVLMLSLLGGRSSP